jgi:prepilin-type N-terminal cleavage/methylation domain-containing protein
MYGRGEEPGFSLVETLIALAIVALVMTVGMSLLAQQSGVVRRQEAHQEAMRIIESTLEGVRGGLVPLISGRQQVPVTSTQTDALVLWMEVTPRDEPPNLFEVSVEARYVVGSQTLRRGVKTMVWSP